VHCFACFSQRKDPTNPRGYFQKSVVFLTKIKLYGFFKRLFVDVALAYFKAGDDQLLFNVFDTMNNKWPQPEHISELEQVELLGTKYVIKSEKELNYKNRFSEDNIATHSGNKMIVLDEDDPETVDLKMSKSTPARSGPGEDMSITQSTPKGSQKPGLCDDFKDINLYRILGRQPACLVFRLWEIMMLNESLLILADSPIVCR
jgi:hypothetical protein